MTLKAARSVVALVLVVLALVGVEIWKREPVEAVQVEQAQRVESSAGLATDGRSKRSRLLAMGLVGAASGVACWPWDW